MTSIKQIKPKVLVAMSGGVDSSSAAVLLLDEGYQVIGVFMKFWNEGLGQGFDQGFDQGLGQGLGQGFDQGFDQGLGQGTQSTRILEITPNAVGNPNAGSHGPLSNAGSHGPLSNAGSHGPLTLPENKCCSLEAYQDAQRVADKLGIKLYTMNMKSVFKKQVVDYFLKEYRQGQTPNPCVECNRYVKFGELLRRAKRLGCDYIATGHYVRLKHLTSNTQLLTAKDTNKDQSYFLWTLTQDQLKHCLFPVGDYTKAQVRVIAKKRGLPVYNKEESQGLCFVNDKRHYDFLRRHLKLNLGPIISFDGIKEKGIKPGSIVGEHQGLPLYTIGQRREILIGGIGPFYVVKCDYQRNALYVASKFDRRLLYGRELVARDANWISGEAPRLPFECKAKIRYGQPAVDCRVSTKGAKQRKFLVEFTRPQRAVTPGQSVVFYRGNEVLGGGVIALRKPESKTLKKQKSSRALKKE